MSGQYHKLNEQYNEEMERKECLICYGAPKKYAYVFPVVYVFVTENVQYVNDKRSGLIGHASTKFQCNKAIK